MWTLFWPSFVMNWVKIVHFLIKAFFWLSPDFPLHVCIVYEVYHSILYFLQKKHILKYWLIQFIVGVRPPVIRRLNVLFPQVLDLAQQRVTEGDRYASMIPTLQLLWKKITYMWPVCSYIATKMCSVMVSLWFERESSASVKN